MRTAVHTRRIVDPIAGVKLTGTTGRYTYGTLISPDASVGPDAHKVYGIGRAVRNFGDAQYVGALVTDTEFRRDHNRVVAADFALKHGASVNEETSDPKEAYARFGDLKPVACPDEFPAS
jgi:hypothetical protein